MGPISHRQAASIDGYGYAACGTDRRPRSPFRARAHPSDDLRFGKTSPRQASFVLGRDAPTSNPAHPASLNFRTKPPLLPNNLLLGQCVFSAIQVQPGSAARSIHGTIFHDVDLKQPPARLIKVGANPKAIADQFCHELCPCRARSSRSYIRKLQNYQDNRKSHRACFFGPPVACRAMHKAPARVSFHGRC